MDVNSIFQKNKDRVFIIDAATGECWTYARFYRLIKMIGAYLRDRGVKRGDRVAVCLPNSVPFAALYFCAPDVLFTIIPLNTHLNRHELAYICGSSKAKFLILSPLAEPYFRDISHALEVIRLPEKQELSDEESPFAWRGSADDIFSIMYTSGTTRMPKGVAHRFGNMFQNASSFIRALEITPEYRFYNVLSMAYMAGFYNLIFLPFVAGASVVIGETFSPRQALDFWKYPVQQRVNALWLVPTMLSILLKLDRNEKGADYCRQFMKKLFVGTAPLPVRLRKEFEDKYGVCLYESYGLSETLLISAVTDETLSIEGSVGRILPDAKLTLLQDGEIAVKTAGMMAGYVNDQDGSIDRVDSDAYFSTGDLGRLDPEGNLFITGRKKDLIIKGGINISPLALEEVMMRDDAVDRAAVIGHAHTIYGEEIIAVVTLKQGFQFADIEPRLMEHCRQNFSEVQRPHLILEIEQFPLTVTGKINKEKLKNLISAKLKLSQ